MCEVSEHPFLIKNRTRYVSKSIEEKKFITHKHCPNPNACVRYESPHLSKSPFFLSGKYAVWGDEPPREKTGDAAGIKYSDTVFAAIAPGMLALGMLRLSLRLGFFAALFA